ncbi:MAG: response regulator [Microthrixaceae bacterium]|nr:response regulator [Microthrixaceae bacterium]MCB9386899.1 response regulator [Microthrixaceae bacterium]MCO5321281.1 response regulator [Microthrixaceae bacterium]
MNARPDTLVLVATDSDGVFDDIDAAIADEHTSLQRVNAGSDVRGAVLATDPDLVICDLQIGNMGGVATALDLRLEEGAGRLEARPIMLLLDREADEFIARRSGADAWLTKPLESLDIRRTVSSLVGDSSRV